MSKKNKPNDLSFIEVVKATASRLKLSSLYHSGELEHCRKHYALLTECPWQILRYEHIVDPKDFIFPLPSLNYVTPKTFAKHLKQLKKECNVVPLQELVEAILKEEQIPDKTVAITIDGGWKDSFLYAAPLIKEHQLPASIFISANLINNNDFFWREKAAMALLAMHKADMQIHAFDFFYSHHGAYYA